MDKHTANKLGNEVSRRLKFNNKRIDEEVMRFTQSNIIEAPGGYAFVLQLGVISDDTMKFIADVADRHNVKAKIETVPSGHSVVLRVKFYTPKHIEENRIAHSDPIVLNSIGQKTTMYPPQARFTGNELRVIRELLDFYYRSGG